MVVHPSWAESHRIWWLKRVEKIVERKRENVRGEKSDLLCCYYLFSKCKGKAYIHEIDKCHVSESFSQKSHILSFYKVGSIT